MLFYNYLLQGLVPKTNWLRKLDFWQEKVYLLLSILLKANTICRKITRAFIIYCKSCYRREMGCVSRIDLGKTDKTLYRPVTIQQLVKAWSPNPMRSEILRSESDPRSIKHSDSIRNNPTNSTIKCASKCELTVSVKLSIKTTCQEKSCHGQSYR